MQYETHELKGLPVSVHTSGFQGPSGVAEYHLILRPTVYGDMDSQLSWLNEAYRTTLESMRLGDHTAILKRFFCSDLMNQMSALKVSPLSVGGNDSSPCALSYVGQPPASPAKVALWAYHVSDPDDELRKTEDGDGLILRRGELSHRWTTGMTAPSAGTCYDQTRGIFEQYEEMLQGRNSSVADNLIRTWLFVDNIDANYQGLVQARREFFAKHGLTPETHFIASSGIEGSHADIATRVAMDAYAISSVQPEQIEFLAAPQQMSPTHLYGVTFERGTAVGYQDRRHLFISGTASIDHQGSILHPGNVLRQLERTLENVEALLKQADAMLGDMCLFVVYVRDPADQEIVEQHLRARFGDAPIVVVTARVCRPGWLVEVEGQAVIPVSNPGLPPF